MNLDVIYFLLQIFRLVKENFLFVRNAKSAAMTTKLAEVTFKIRQKWIFYFPCCNGLKTRLLIKFQDCCWKRKITEIFILKPFSVLISKGNNQVLYIFFWRLLSAFDFSIRFILIVTALYRIALFTLPLIIGTSVTI